MIATDYTLLRSILSQSQNERVRGGPTVGGGASSRECPGKTTAILGADSQRRAPAQSYVEPDYPCYACGAEATHEIQHRGGWLDVCDDCDEREAWMAGVPAQGPL